MWVGLWESPALVLLVLVLPRPFPARPLARLRLPAFVLPPSLSRLRSAAASVRTRSIPMRSLVVGSRSSGRPPYVVASSSAFSLSFSFSSVVGAFSSAVRFVFRADAAAAADTSAAGADASRVRFRADSAMLERVEGRGLKGEG